MEGRLVVVPGRLTERLVQVRSLQGAVRLHRRSTTWGWKLGSQSRSLQKGFVRRGNGLRRHMLPMSFACLESLDADNELLSLGHYSSAACDHFDVREARVEHELKGAAWLRAEAYSEQQAYTRYVDSFKKKFAEQEFSALKRRVSGQPGSYICLVAVSTVLPKDTAEVTWQESGEETRVLGTLDVSLHHPSPGEAFGGQGLPYGYIANVCVDKSSRKQGIASTLMDHAVQVGRKWGLNAIYVHTQATNGPAYKLYLKKGFEVLQSGSPQKLVDGNLLLRLQM